MPAKNSDIRQDIICPKVPVKSPWDCEKSLGVPGIMYIMYDIIHNIHDIMYDII